jgi:hypothetical protein
MHARQAQPGGQLRRLVVYLNLLMASKTLATRCGTVRYLTMISLSVFTFVPLTRLFQVNAARIASHDGTTRDCTDTEKLRPSRVIGLVGV